MSVRGLPDERPISSVKNLIGRYEKQASKRQSSIGPGGLTPAGQNSASPITSPSQSRATSVVSHTTGDSALIEARERREWPPKPKEPGTNGTPTSSFNVADLRRSLETNVTTTSKLGVVTPPPTDVPSDGQGSLSASVESIFGKQDSVQKPPPPANSDPIVPEEEDVKSEPEAKKESPATARAIGKLTTSKSTPTSTASKHTTAGGAGTIKSAVTPRPSIAQSKSTSSAPATKTATPHTAKPLTAQRTGSSVASAGAGSAAARAGTKNPPVSAASRAKTPTALRASTSGAGSHLKAAHQASPLSAVARAKTPTASSARSKTPTASHPPKHTPSSGLHAPTKASLARAKNAEAGPPPVPKPVVNSGSLERLMRPTAASASKAREGPVSPPRAPAPVKTAGRGAASPSLRGKMLKPRVGLAPARMKAEREKKEKEGITKKRGAPAVATGVAAASIAHPDASQEHVTSEDESFSVEHEHEQPSFVSTTALSETSLGDDEHAGPPSDIESYDDAFASDDDRALELDRAHLVSARPSEEGEREPFTGTDTPEFPDIAPTPQGPTFVHPPAAQTEEPEHEQEHEHGREHEAVTGFDSIESTVPDADPAAHTTQLEVVEKEANVVPVPEAPTAADPVTTLTGAQNGSAETEAIDSKQNGTSVSPEPETTEFDSVLGMLAVKPPPRSVSPGVGVIPDEE